MQLISIALFVGVVWLAVKGFKAFKRKTFKRGFKFLGLSFALFLVMGIAIGIYADSPQGKQESAQQAADEAAQAKKDAAQKAQDAQKKAQQDVQKAAQKAQQDEKAKLVAQFKEAGANDEQAGYYTDGVMKLEGDKAKQEAIQSYLKAAKSDKESNEYMEWVNSQFSAWDGSCPALVDAVKQSMNDPSSFKHVETTYESMGVKKGIKVYMTFRGTNAFGGVVTNHATATFKYGEKTFTFTTGG